MSDTNLNFKNIENFRDYQKLIYEYINQGLIRLPLFFENQPKLNNTTIPNGVMQKGGVVQKTIRDGQIIQGRKVSEPMISFDNVYSESLNDLNIIQYIATKLAGDHPTETLLKVDAYLWYGIPSLEGPISDIPAYYNTGTSLGNYLYIPYIELGGYNEKLFINWYDGKLNLDYDNYINSLDTINVQYTDFVDLLKTEGKFNCSLAPYNLSDNTGNFLPVGVKKRKISKKLLRETSDTAITEILPNTQSQRVDNFFRGWQKTQKIIPIGQQYIVGNTFLNNGDFSGGVGPGSFRMILQNGAQTEQFNLLLAEEYNDLYLQMFNTLGDAGPGNNLYPFWQSGETGDARLTQKIIDKENPGFSPFVYSSTRQAPNWYDIQIPSAELSPGLDYTLSMWQAEDTGFNPSNFPELALGTSFFYAITIKAKNDNVSSNEVLARDWATGDRFASPEEYAASISGQPIETWQGEELMWTRFKKTISLPSSDDKLIALNGELFPSDSHTYKIYWFIGYQNSIEGVYRNSEYTFNGKHLFAGPDIRCNNNQAMQYVTGMRINRGQEITGTAAIELSGGSNKSIVKVLQDCVNILEPYDFDVPIYSKGKIDSLLLSQQASARVLLLLTEIKEGLITGITTLAGGISETYSTFAENYMQTETTEQFVELQQLKNDFMDMINDTGITNNIDNLNLNLTNTFQLLSSNTIAQPVETISIVPIFQNLSGVFNAPGYYNGRVQVKVIPVGEYIGHFHGNDAGTFDQVISDGQGTPIHIDYIKYYGSDSFGTTWAHGSAEGGAPHNGYVSPSIVSMAYYNEAPPLYDNGYPLRKNYAPEFLTDPNETGATPIGAFYESELYTPTTDDGIRQGEPTPNGSSEPANGYPSVGYGYYAQSGFNSNWRAKVEEVYNNYFHLYQLSNPGAVQTVPSEQFSEMSVGSTFINTNFVPLRTYNYKVGTGQDFMAWIYINQAANGNEDNAFNWVHSATGVSYPGEGLYGDSLPGARGLNYLNMWESFNYGNQWDGEKTFRCYEPHWEWDITSQSWRFRFAQPVIGTENQPNNSIGYSDEELLQDVGEKKYKFANMAIKKVVG